MQNHYCNQERKVRFMFLLIGNINNKTVSSCNLQITVCSKPSENASCHQGYMLLYERQGVLWSFFLFLQLLGQLTCYRWRISTCVSCITDPALVHSFVITVCMFICSCCETWLGTTILRSSRYAWKSWISTVKHVANPTVNYCFSFFA